MKINHEKFAASLDQDYPGIRDQWLFAIENMNELESPLEVEFLAQWMISTYQSLSCSFAGQMFCDAERVFDISSQCRIGNFRVDFLLSLFTDDGACLARAAIEADGFSYHGDRSSFETDRQRDQYLQSKGMNCFRFTQVSIRRENPLQSIFDWARNYRPIPVDLRLDRANEDPSSDISGAVIRHAKHMIEAQIWAVRGDPTEMKFRIMTAWEDGHLSPAEAESWIMAWGLETA